MTAARSRTTLRALALALLAGAGAAPRTLQAQDLPRGLPAPGDGFTWERVGDRPIIPDALAFGPDHTLWASSPYGPCRLDTTGGFPGQWVFLSDYANMGPLLVLGRGAEGDTLVSGRGRTDRSVDGGVTWEEVYDWGGDGLYEIPAGLPHAGRILTGDNTGLEGAIAYSDDRAASFAASVTPGQPGSYGGADDFVALPPDSGHPGRILAAGSWGVNVSDDGGAIFRKSGLWQAVYYYGEAVGVVERPGGGLRAIVAGYINGQPHRRVWVSDDDGETWGPEGGYPLPEGPPDGIGGAAAAVLPLGGSSALVVLGRGTVYRTDDAGETWVPVGRAPDVDFLVALVSAALGPDRRLYVGLLEAGSVGERSWVWRTQERMLPVAVEPGPEEREPLGVEVRPNPIRGEASVVLTLAEAGEVEAALYDVLGRRVATLASGRFPAGRHELGLDGAALPAGVYVVRVVAGGVVQTRRVTLVR